MAGGAELVDDGDDTTSTPRHWWVLALVLVAGLAPIIVAAVSLAAEGWVPIGEYAQAELRVRDFWDHPPSLGAVGRLRTETDVSSHPGPSAWWAMYPVYGMLGRSAVALSAAVAATAGAWLATAVVVAWRRGGDALAVVIGLALLVLMASVGAIAFVEPWNPWFALLPFVCLLLGTWRCVEGSPWALVLVVAAGTYCVQAHLGYGPFAAVLGVTALAGLWWSGPRRDGDWHRMSGPVLVAVGAVLVMWLPPVIEQLAGDPGNLTILVEAYREESGAQEELGPVGAVEMVAAHLSVGFPSLTSDEFRPTDRSAGIGTVVMLLGWAAATVVARRGRRDPRMRSALALGGVTAVGVVTAVLAASQIPGEVFGYLVLWLGALAAMVVAVIGWTAWLALPVEPRFRRILAGGAVGVLTVTSALVTVDFSDPPVPGDRLSGVAEELVEPVAEAVADGAPYLVRWEDPVAFGGVGTAVLSELERSGVDVGVDEHLRVEMRPHRVMEPDTASAAIWVVSGAGIDRWAALPDAEELARVDQRTPQERERADGLRAEILAELERIGADDLAAAFDRNHWAVRSDPRVDGELEDRIEELSGLGLPTAVFLVPTGTPQPPAQ